MISNAKNKSVGNLPNMSQTIISWFQPLTFITLKKTVDNNFEEVITETKVNTQGVVQPPKPEIIEIQPEGIRNWEWLEIHCLPNLQLNINEYIIYNGLKYKVMQKENYAAYGYMLYRVLEAYRERV